MWYVNGSNLQMAEGDFGIGLPVTIKGTEIEAGDSLKFTFKNKKNGTVILEKVYRDIVDNTVELEFTEEQSSQFTVGSYVYSLDWFQNDSFMCNIILDSIFKVVDKA